MRNTFDYSKEYGLVLEGGGAKGAYQIGVWKGLLECGVKIKGISGVSVGALNGALICMGDYLKAEDIWKNLSYSTIMKIDSNLLNQFANFKLKDINLLDAGKGVIKMLTEGGIDITPFFALLDQWVDTNCIIESNIELIIGTFYVSKLKEVEVKAQEFHKNSLKHYLLASALLPIFQNDKIYGKRFLDGGIFNNVPINMLLKRGYRDIIVVRIYGIGMEKRVKIPEKVNIIEIAPTVDLGGILEFDPIRINRNIKMGYYDTLKILRGLKGKKYYIDINMTEEEGANFFTFIPTEMKLLLLQFFKINSCSRNCTRKFLEFLCPKLARLIHLNKEWTYVELYIGLLELCGKKLRVPVFTIYNRDRLVKKIYEKYLKLIGKNIRLPRLYELIVFLLASNSSEYDLLPIMKLGSSSDETFSV